MMMLVKYSGSFAGDSWSSVQCEYVLPTDSQRRNPAHTDTNSHASSGCP